MIRIVHVAGARPNFMKVAPVMESLGQAAGRRGVALEQILVHTGQHYDRAMSDLFFEQLGLPRPDVNLNVGSGSHGEQTGRIMERFETVLIERRPDMVVVVGDVNSTVACALDARKLGIPVAHVEAGLRSLDRSMPEEINRLATDAISDLLLVTDRYAEENLRREGAPPESIHFVGNVMIDTLMKHKAHALSLPVLEQFGLRRDGHTQPYALMTLHRPANVDRRDVLQEIGETLAELGRDMTILFPAHPRTRSRIGQYGLDGLFSEANGIRRCEPLGYLEFLNLMANAQLILTDSGGIQEESTILGVPCLTLRPNTERPVTISEGTNRLVNPDRRSIAAALAGIGKGSGSVPPLWDGHAGQRVAEVLLDYLDANGAQARAAGT